MTNEPHNTGHHEVHHEGRQGILSRMIPRGTRKLASAHSLPLAIVAAGIMVAAAIVYTNGGQPQAAKSSRAMEKLQEEVLPPKGVVLPVTWGDLGQQLVSAGVIDAEKFKAIYENRGALTKEYENLLFGKENGKVRITEENAGYLLNLFWALGLGQKNDILEKGEMTNPRYGGPQNFASTGGWTVSKGNVMDHYSHHAFFALTSEQQQLVEKVAQGVYRPCCGNSTHFPDCNHGMAMLGLLELMASQGASEKDMWEAALAVNSYWFPETYVTIAAYMKQNGVDWKDVNPEDVLGINYSSAQGYAQVASRVILPEDGQGQGGGGCGIDTGAAPKQQGGCGI